MKEANHKNFLVFSERLSLEKLIERWAAMNGDRVSVHTVILFLQNADLLNIEGAREYIKENNGKTLIDQKDYT